MSIKYVYVAGPMRGIPYFNFPAFDETAQYLGDLGYIVCNPAARDREMHGANVNNSATGDLDDPNVVDSGFSLREALDFDTSFICLKGDAVCVLPGWENSKGAQAEVALAKALGQFVGTLDDFIDLANSDLAEKRESNLKAIFFPEERRLTDIPILPSSTGEVRSVSSSGGEKGVKPQRLDLLPVLPLLLTSEHFAAGAKKYADHNWRKGYEWSKSYAALLRHLFAFWGGEDIDEETGSHHLQAVAFHSLVLLEYTHAERYAQFDDRYKP